MPLFRLPLRRERQVKRKAQAGRVQRSADKEEKVASDAASASASASESQSDIEAEDEHKEDHKGEQEKKVNHEVNAVERLHRSKRHRSQRYQHIEVLVTLIHRCVQTQDWERALRGYSMLLRIPDTDIKLCYDMGLEILLNTERDKALEFMSRLIVAFPPLQNATAVRNGIVQRTPRADVFVRILTVHRIKQGRLLEAVEALDQWLLVPPFRDDRILWRYFNAICSDLEAEAQEKEDAAAVIRWRAKRLKAEKMNSGNQAETASQMSSRS